MLLRCLKAELQKCRRSPVWLAFPVLPIFPAILGTGNYLGNLEALENGRYSLWSRHALFSPMFFLPALLGVSCAWQWRLEHTDHNWNSFLTAPVPVRDLYGAKLILAAVVSLFGPGMHWRFVSPQREDRRHLRPGAAGAAGVAALRGSRRHVGLRGAALFQPGDPCLCPAGGFRPGGRHSGPEVHRPGGDMRSRTPCCAWRCGPTTLRWSWICRRFSAPPWSMPQYLHFSPCGISGGGMRRRSKDRPPANNRGPVLFLILPNRGQRPAGSGHSREGACHSRR